MNPVLRDPDYRAKLPKHGFPLTHSRHMTASFGQLLPVFYDILNPGEKVRFKTNWFTRSMPLSTAAMVRIREHVEYFFVPFEQIYSLFDSWRYDINDVKSSVFTIANISDNLPVVKYADINTWMSNHGTEYCGGLEPYAGDPSDFDTYDSGTFRLFDNLGYDVKTLLSGYTWASGRSFCPYLLCAYQKIFNDVYRCDDYTAPAPNGWNMDSGYQGSWTPDFANLLALRYRPYYKDYFTVTKPSPLTNSVSMLGNAGSRLTKVNQWLDTRFSYGSSSSSIVGTDSGGAVTPASGDVAAMSYAGLSANVANTENVFVSAPQLRTMFALEKLLQITGRAGKHYDAQTLAHFGFEVPRGVSGEVYRLGGQSQTFMINEVVATASGIAGAGSVLGEIAGKGYSVTEKAQDNEFVAPCDGIFMAIYSAVPEINYVSRFDKLNSKVKRQDFYLPERDNLGMQPLFAYEIWGSTYNISGMSRVSGWQYAYQESKTKYNVASLAFATGNAFADWTLHFDINDLGSYDYKEYNVYCNPCVCDSIFLVGYQNRPSVPTSDDYAAANAVYSSDHLVIDFDFQISKASYMSPFGIPNL